MHVEDQWHETCLERSTPEENYAYTVLDGDSEFWAPHEPRKRRTPLLLRLQPLRRDRCEQRLRRPVRDLLCRQARRLAGARRVLVRGDQGRNRGRVARAHRRGRRRETRHADRPRPPPPAPRRRRAPSSRRPQTRRRRSCREDRGHDVQGYQPVLHDGALRPTPTATASSPTSTCSRPGTTPASPPSPPTACPPSSPIRSGPPSAARWTSSESTFRRPPSC